MSLKETDVGQRRLENWRKDKHSPVVCGCNQRQLPLSVVFNGHFWLRIYPGTGEQHHRQCTFFRVRDTLSTNSQYTNGARKEREDGAVVIRGTLPLAVKSGSRSGVSDLPEKTTSVRPQYRRMSGLGLLQDIWTHAELCLWRPGFADRRNGYTALQRIRNYADRVIYNKEPLSRRLAFLGAMDGSCYTSALKAGFAPAEAFKGDTNARFLVLGTVIGWGESSVQTIKIALNETKRSIFLSQDAFNIANRRYPRAFTAIEHQNSHAIGLFSASWTAKGFVVAHEMILMPTNLQFIPVDSQYERQVADKLIEEGRAFEKPLKAEPHESTLPDFVLTDTEVVTVMEVFGVQGNRRYEQRKAEKLALYAQERVSVWQWEPAVDGEIPAFPDRANQ